MKSRLVLIILIFVCSSQSIFAKVALPNIFSDNMVLQRNAEVRFWGWGGPGEKITITTGWDGKSYDIQTVNDANWELTLSTPGAGGPFVIQFKGSDNEVVLQNVMIGEVWLCSGQSNMEWSANSGLDNAESEIRNANHPNIRLFSVDKRTSDAPQNDLPGTWEVCTPESMANFSAVAYFFATRLQGEMNVPLGMIDSSWGATCAEVWAPAQVFETHSELKEAAKKIEPNQWVTTKPSSLYNAMIAPITDFRIAGALWYQGESNTANAATYEKMFGTMIGSWREKWGYDFPFYFVQIAPYKYGSPEVGVMVRNQQRKTLALPQTGMVVVSDICTVEDIHPRNKQDVGLRLANMALKQHYKLFDGEVYGPTFKEIQIEGKKVTVLFDHGQGLWSKEKKMTQFEVAGSDGQFFPAKASIKDNMVVLSAKEVRVPTKVRFAWDNTDLATLFNAAGLPASSFISE